MAGKYYWLKLKRDFFKRHDIRVIEAMPNGKDYILFYLKLLLESVDHDGMLRFNDRIPYNESMLSTVTDTNVDIVRSAIKIFSELNMIDVMDDGTYFMSEVQKMIGSASNSEGAERVRRYRERLKEIEQNTTPLITVDVKTLQNVTDVTTNSNESKSKDKSKSIDIKKISLSNDRDTKESRFAPPSVDEVDEYIREKGYHVAADAFCAFYDSNGWRVGRNPMKDWRRALVTWEKRRQVEQPKQEEPQGYRYKRFTDDGY